MIVASRRQCAAPEFIAMAEKAAGLERVPPGDGQSKIETVEQLVTQFRAEGCDSMVAIGGGSPMDAAKAAAARLARPSRSVAQLKGLLRVHKKIVPFAAVPTTAGTGSETTIAAVVTDENHHKYAVNDLCLIPRWGHFRPGTDGVPAGSGNGGNGAGRPDPRRGGIHWPVLQHTGDKRPGETSGEGHFYVFTQGLRRRERSPCPAGAADSVLSDGFRLHPGRRGQRSRPAHTLGGLYDVPHGRANAVLLPVMLEAYGPAVYRRLAELADVVGLCPAGSQAEKAPFIAAIYDMNRARASPQALTASGRRTCPKWRPGPRREANPRVYPVPVIFDKDRFIRVAKRVMLS